MRQPRNLTACTARVCVSPNGATATPHRRAPRRVAPGLLALCLLAVLQLPWAVQAGSPPSIAASIKPVHDLLMGLVKGVTEPALLIPPGASPHDYALRPSDMRSLQRARLVVWIGPELENFLIRPLAGLPDGTRRITLLHDADLVIHRVRQGGVWDDHDHGHDHDHDRGHDHAGEAPDAHVWLSPENARRIVRHMAAELSALDPDNSDSYRANRDTMLERIDRLEGELAQMLEPVRQRPYIVFHDGYQYFERHFGLTPAGSITLDPSRPPGARRVQDIRRRVQNTGALCVFSEPQFRPAIVSTVIEGTEARTGTLDPIGAHLPSGPEGYEQLLRNLARDLVECLDG